MLVKLKQKTPFIIDHLSSIFSLFVIAFVKRDICFLFCDNTKHAQGNKHR